jgi:hypothetical protein
MTGHESGELAPPTGSVPLLRWVRGPLSVPYRLSTPAYKLKEKTTTRCATTGYHVSCGSGPWLRAEVGSSTTTCPSAPNLASP